MLPLTEGSRNRQSRVGPRRQRGLGPKLEPEEWGRQPQVPRLDEALCPLCEGPVSNMLYVFFSYFAWVLLTSDKEPTKTPMPHSLAPAPPGEAPVFLTGSLGMLDPRSALDHWRPPLCHN